jgi:hypothetical protein
MRGGPRDECQKTHSTEVATVTGVTVFSIEATIDFAIEGFLVARTEC